MGSKTPTLQNTKITTSSKRYLLALKTTPKSVNKFLAETPSSRETLLSIFSFRRVTGRLYARRFAKLVLYTSERWWAYSIDHCLINGRLCPLWIHVYGNVVSVLLNRLHTYFMKQCEYHVFPCYNHIIDWENEQACACIFVVRLITKKCWTAKLCRIYFHWGFGLLAEETLLE